MKYLCVAYYDDEKAFDAVPKPECHAIVSECAEYDEALRASGHLAVEASLGSPRATTTVRPAHSQPELNRRPGPCDS